MATGKHPTLLRSASYFPVSDVDATVAYYERVLGFVRDYSAGSPTEFAICSRDGLAILFRRVPDPETIRPNKAQGGAWDVFFWVKNVLALHSELKTRGANVTYGPILQQTYQMQEFAVRDQDGHVLGFGEPQA